MLQRNPASCNISGQENALYHNINLPCYKDERRVNITAAGSNSQEINGSRLISCPKNATNIRQGKGMDQFRVFSLEMWLMVFLIDLITVTYHFSLLLNLNATMPQSEGYKKFMLNACIYELQKLSRGEFSLSTLYYY